MENEKVGETVTFDYDCRKLGGPTMPMGKMLEFFKQMNPGLEVVAFRLEVIKPPTG